MDDDSIDEDNEDTHNFIFQASMQPPRVKKAGTSALLVDSGASVHIMTDKCKFIRFNKDFEPDKQIMQMADGSRETGTVLCKGDASVLLYDVNGEPKEMIMKDALYIPSYKFDILSVQAATRKGVRVNFEPDHADLVTSDGSLFSVEREGNLYFIENVGNTHVNSASTAEE